MWQLMIAVCAWTAANLFFKIARVNISTTGVVMWQTVGIVIATLIIVLMTRGQHGFFDRPLGVFLALLGGAISIVGAYFFLEALGTVRLAIAVPFSSLYVVLTCILSVLLLREKMSVMQVIGAVITVIGSMLLGISNAK